jgi:hypothetical protein
MDRTEESVSVDMMARLLVDVHQDTSQIMNDLLSAYQRNLMDMVFMGDADLRGKFNMIISEGIDPFCPAEEYLDRKSKENELKQVLGDLHKSFDLGDEGVLIVGRDGILVAGANAGDCEELLVSYLGLLCREMFIRNYFTRTFVMDALLKKIRELILSYQQDPNHIPDIRMKINDASRDIILLEETLSILRESLMGMKVPERPNGVVEGVLFDKLAVAQQMHDVGLRATDLSKLINGQSQELNNLQQMTDVINTKQLEDVFKDIEANTKYLVDASAADERASASLEVMQVILSGSLAFQILDRLSGGSLNSTPPDWFYAYFVDTIINKPMGWFFVNMTWLLIVSKLLLMLMAYLGEQANGALILRAKVNKKVNIARLLAYIATKTMEVTNSVSAPEGETRKITWKENDKEKWKVNTIGDCPKVEVQVNETYGFLLSITFNFNLRRTELKEEEIFSVFVEEFNSLGITREGDFDELLSNLKHESDEDNKDIEPKAAGHGNPQDEELRNK